MITKEECNQILREYPEYISKDQMFRLCHISKKTCLHLLQSGLVPCIDSGKKTRRYKIRTADVILYLKRRERNPQKYRPKAGYYGSSQGRRKKPAIITLEEKQKARELFESKLEEYPDVLTTSQVSALLDRHQSLVIRWCREEKLRSFSIRGKYRIPKEYLREFLEDEKRSTLLSC